MELTDIVTLFVPIFFNGVILFLFQKIINNKFEENSVKNQIKKEVYQNYFIKFQKIYNDINVSLEAEFFLDAESLASGSYDADEFEEKFRKTKLYCTELISYYKTYKKILDEKNLLKEKHEKITEIMEEYGTTEDCIEMYNKIHPIINEINEQAIELLLY